MIKNLSKNRISVDKRGKITTGLKVANKTGAEYPKAVDYFVIDEFPELVKVYGSKPKKLVIVFPSDEILDFFQADYVLYGGNNQMIRKCDGEECIHRIQETVTIVNELDELGNLHSIEPYSKTYEAGEISECICKLMPQTIVKDGQNVRNPKRCNCAMYMKAYIVDYKEKRLTNSRCYMFYSGSENTASNIYSELHRIKMLAGRLSGLPFGLSVEMVAGRTNAKVKYPIWNLQVLGDISHLENPNKSLLDYKSVLEDNHKQPEENQLPEVTSEQSEINLYENPLYWVKKIESIGSIKELKEFEDAHGRDISIFNGKDLMVIQDAITKKIKSLRG